MSSSKLGPRLGKRGLFYITHSNCDPFISLSVVVVVGSKQSIVSASQNIVIGLIGHSRWTRTTKLYLSANRNSNLY